MPRNLRKKLLVPLSLIWGVLLVTFLLILHQAHRSLLDREASSARLHAEHFSQQLLLAEAQSQEPLLARLAASPLTRQALQLRNVQRLRQQAQTILEVSAPRAGTTNLHFYSANLEPLVDQHHAASTGGEYADQVLRQARETLRPAHGLGLAPPSTLTFWSAFPCRDQDRTLLGFILAGKQLSFLTGSTEPPRQALKAPDHSAFPEFLLLLNKHYLDRDRWEAEMQSAGRRPQWDLLPDMVLAGHSFPTTEEGNALAALKTAAGSNTGLITLTGRHWHLVNQPLLDIKNRPVGRILLLTDIHTNIRTIQRSYYTVLTLFLLLAPILYLLTSNFLSKIEQRFANLHQRLVVENMDRDTITSQHHQDLQKSWHYLQNIIEGLGTPLLAINKDYRITLANRSVNNLFLRPLPDTPYCRDLFHLPDEAPTASDPADCHHLCPAAPCPVREVFKTGQPYETIISIPTQDNRPLIMQAMAWPIFDDHGTVIQVVIVLNDITTHKESEAQLQRELTLNRGLADLAKAFIEPHLSMDKISALVRDQLKTITGSQLSFTGYLDQETNDFICPSMSIGAMEECRATEGHVRFEIFRGLWGWVLEHRQPILSNEPAKDPRSTGLPDGHLPIQNFLAVPAVIQGELVGEIAVANSDTPYTEQDLHALEQFAVLFGIAIQRQRWVEALAESREEAVAANRSKDQFIANMSHELRTPLNGILGMNNLLLATELTSRQHKYLTMSKNSAEGLLRIINDILDFSKVATEQLPIVNTTFALTETLQELIEIFTLDAHAKGLSLKLQIQNHLPRILEGDTGRLRQILTNLINNAIKFTEGGEITLEVERYEGVLDGHKRDMSKTYLCFTVRDTGIGIAEENMAHLFKEFTQLDGSLTRKYGGTGLGLSFSKKLAELMQGQLWCESVAGKGSAFHCLLPFTAQKDAPPLSEQTSASPPSTARQSTAPSRQKLHILLAEDDLINREVAMEYIQRRNWQVTAVTDGAAAVESFRATPFDLILMDVQMPKMDGLEATCHIREIERQSGRHTPIIALTAHTQPEFRDQCLVAGMDDFLSKPLSPDSLYGTIENNINMRQDNHIMEKQSPSGKETPIQKEDDRETINLSLMRAALHDNWDLLKKLINHFNDTAPQQLQTLQEAIAGNDLEQARQIAHALKGTLSNFGARTATDLAAELERAAATADLNEAENIYGELTQEVDHVRHALAGSLRECMGSEQTEPINAGDQQ